MNINFPLILALAVIISGVIWLVDAVFFARKRGDKKPPNIVDYARSFFPILLAVFVIRSFIVEPFRIPSGSLEPTLLKGDFILVNKYDYGLRLPVINRKLFHLGEPKVGDVVVFRWPPNPTIDYIKRVVGVPGDRISYINKVLYINDKEANQQPKGASVDADTVGQTWTVNTIAEALPGKTHSIYVRPDVSAYDFKDVVVPPNQYFVMGDNRDNSLDSRFWGFVPENNLLGKAFAIWFSWNADKGGVRWSRIGSVVQ